MILNKQAVYIVYFNLPFGEKRNEKEISKAVRDKENPEHDYLKDLYLLEIEKLKGGFKK